MKKINAKHSDKDRIICATSSSTHEFFYQPVDSKDKLWLFSTAFSGSVFTYFRDHGRGMGEGRFSLTLKEFYRFKEYRNYTLANLMDRIPKQIEYVIKELLRTPKEPITALHPASTRNKRSSSFDDERAA